jgi:hypothetical protein
MSAKARVRKPAMKRPKPTHRTEKADDDEIEWWSVESEDAASKEDESVEIDDTQQSTKNVKRHHAEEHKGKDWKRSRHN